MHITHEANNHRRHLSIVKGKRASFANNIILLDRLMNLVVKCFWNASFWSLFLFIGTHFRIFTRKIFHPLAYSVRISSKASATAAKVSNRGHVFLKFLRLKQVYCKFGVTALSLHGGHDLPTSKISQCFHSVLPTYIARMAELVFIAFQAKNFCQHFSTVCTFTWIAERS